MIKLWKRVKEIIRSICIVDRFLIIFMLVLFFYMVFHLFTGISDSQDTNTIDVIVRTSLAAIFGYFISSNFARADLSTAPQNTENPNINVNAISDPHVQNQIGFQASMASSSEELGRISFSESSSTPIKYCSKIQVFVVSMIGLISLIILFITRCFWDATPELTAMISQLRDFVSACIGFLVSCGKNTAG